VSLVLIPVIIILNVIMDEKTAKRWTTGVVIYLDWERRRRRENEKKIEILWRYFADVFGNVIIMTTLKWRQTDIFMFNFVIISLKHTIWSNHATSDHKHRRLKGAGEWRRPQRLRFLKICKKCILDVSGLKISLKIWNLFIICT